MMSLELIIALVVITIIAIIVTYRILNNMEKQMKKYEDEGVTSAEERERSIRYESESVRKHIPMQIILYIVLIILSVIGFLIYLK